MIIFANLAWPNYYRRLVNRILDTKALYVYKHKNEYVIKNQNQHSFCFKKSCFFRQKTTALHISRKLYKSTKHNEGSNL